MSLVEEALAYAARGWPVFPCDPRQGKRAKAPLVAGPDRDRDGKPIPKTGGLHRASRDEARIRAWWSDHPDALIGVPMGAASGVFVIDLDPRDGETIAEVEARLIEAVGPLPPGPRSRTQSGGAHLWFKVPAGEIPRNSAKQIRGVDWRGGGGYVIVPPSVMSDGAAYEWSIPPDETPFPEPTPALLDLIFKRGRFAKGREAPPLSRAAPRTPVAGVDEQVRKWALSALATELEELACAPSGRRGFTLNKVGFSLGQIVGAGALSESAVIAGMEDAVSRNGLAEADGWNCVRANIVRSVRDGSAQPRDLSDVGRLRGRAASRPADAPFPVEGDFPGVPGSGAPRSSRGASGAEKTAGGGGGGGSDDGGANGVDDGGEEGGRGIDPEVLARCALEPQNDTGNARRLIAHFGADLMNVRDIGEHIWVGTHWEAAGAAEAFVRCAQQTAERIALEAAHVPATRAEDAALRAAKAYEGADPTALTEEEKAIVRRGEEAGAAIAKRRSDRRKFAISCGNSSRIAGMITQALPHMTLAPDEIDADPLSINVRNGTLRIVRELVEDPECPDPDETRLIKAWRVRLDAHAREDRITRVMPVAYDAMAQAPKWQAFLDRFQPDPAIQRFLAQWHGYSLTGLMGEQAFVFNYGLGANGKSTFMEAIARLMGSYAQVLPAEAITGDVQRRGDQATPEMARLPGARLVRCAELPRGQGFRESVIKMLTGGEPILVRHLHKGFFEFRPTFKAIGSGNDRPPIGGVDEGIWRRMKLVPWKVTIPPDERRPMAEVLAEFAAEGAGILNWLLDGLLDYLENGLVVPPEIQAATESYRADMDPVGEFTSACVVACPGADVPAREMYRAYVAWCHANSVKPFAEKTFAVIMTQKGFGKKSGRIRLYLDVMLKDVPDDPDAQAPLPEDAYGER